MHCQAKGKRTERRASPTHVRRAGQDDYLLFEKSQHQKSETSICLERGEETPVGGDTGRREREEEEEEGRDDGSGEREEEGKGERERQSLLDIILTSLHH